ncbi:RNA polymerase sigma-I factor [Ornithinibacillus gellani]|uniref:RNA polymerase sigma-I factor n=1 Tax=Ornithinibacillus gellani TaxID=2293253 RepID=UPI000F48217C|nr:RNA polymerase sigma-I factor [Ornithinibacillus gellani]TQS76574.1 RNA polymerase sigma-I factor [Ornithinibacillus gellani]
MSTSKSLEHTSLEEIVAAAQKGDQQAVHYLLENYKPFIAKCVSEVCKRFINPDTDDEFSIGLFAFHSAIESYSADKGSSFLSFAKLVISRKIIDYIRSNQKYPQSISLDETYDEEKMENPMEIIAVKMQYELDQDNWHRKQEILDFKHKLSTYKLSFAELTKIAPKHKDARDSAIRTARILQQDDQLSAFVKKKKKLPIKELVKQVDVSKKTLERNRKYILAIFIVLNEDYLYLQDYLKGVGK